MRKQLGEPHRTLLGHLRHEVGHYYWDVLVRDSHWLELYRAVRRRVLRLRHRAAAALREWSAGPTGRSSSSGATRPVIRGEDWAETWAHYLHLVDTMNTALAFGLNAEDVDMSTPSRSAPMRCTTRSTRRRTVPVLHQRLGRSGDDPERAVAQHGPARLLPVCQRAVRWWRSLHFIHRHRGRPRPAPAGTGRRVEGRDDDGGAGGVVKSWRPTTLSAAA